MSRSAMPVLLSLAALAAGCSESIAPPQGDAQLRLLHATADLGAVDLAMGTTTVIHGVTFGTGSPLVQVPGGRQRLAVRSGGTTLGEIDVTLSDVNVNTVVVANGVPAYATVVTPDTGNPAPNRANLRLVNVAGTSTSPPTLLDIRLQAPDAQNPDSVVGFQIDTRTASYGPLMYFNPGQFTVKFLPAGGTTVLAQATFSIAAGEKKSMVLERAADGTYRLTIVTEQ